MITPYNSGLVYKRHMIFNDHPTKHYNFMKEEKPERKLSSEWKIMTDFVLNQDKESFRKTCQNINKGLYSQLKAFLYIFINLGNI